VVGRAQGVESFMISAFDLFKIGVGPSSSHTVGPMVAAKAFRDRLMLTDGVAHACVEIFGSLAWTGRGHGTDVALCLGLLGHEPATVDPDAVGSHMAAAAPVPPPRRRALRRGLRPGRGRRL
jgi:L-serine dehydratase